MLVRVAILSIEFFDVSYARKLRLNLEKCVSWKCGIEILRINLKFEVNKRISRDFELFKFEG